MWSIGSTLPAKLGARAREVGFELVDVRQSRKRPRQRDVVETDAAGRHRDGEHRQQDRERAHVDLVVARSVREEREREDVNSEDDDKAPERAPVERVQSRGTRLIRDALLVTVTSGNEVSEIKNPYFLSISRLRTESDEVPRAPKAGRLTA